MTKVGSIEAVLTLNATNFTDGLGTATSALNKFANATTKLNDSKPANAMLQLNDALKQLQSSLGLLDGVSQKNLGTFSKLSNAVKNMATGLQMLQSDTLNLEEAVNTMNSIFESFQGVVQGGTVEVRGLASALRELRALENNNLDKGMNNLRNSVKQVEESFFELSRGVPALNRIDTTSNKVKESIRMMREEVKRAEADLLALGQGVLAFNRIDATSNKVKSQVEMMNAEFNRSKQFLEQMAWTGVEAFNKIDASSNKHNEKLQQVIASDERLKNLKNQLALAIEKEAMANDRDTASAEKNANATNRQSTATRGLGKAMSSLKMIGSMVGSMLVYNFAHNLITATRETVNAKSEMNGYFQMLGYTGNQVDHFNQKLDEMIKKFPRINKYSLGETISSIGVEFELTTKEMEKAMPVVSMITSEYLRAGRNVNEASLAVKDILQGEFQRLSRETGVKGDQLKEAGWSGDKSDVMGLLKALDKVGHDRNWDVFVAKANSLNDAVIILQNRFGEWSADMVEKVQPAIVGVFNDIMSIADPVGKVINGIVGWLSDEGIGQSIVSWTGLGTAITGVALATIHARTGAGLLQIAQNGLLKTIYSTIFGIEAETLAETKLGNQIVATITGLEAEEVATIGKSKAIFGSLLGLDMAILKEEGFRIALLKSTTQMDVARLKAMGLGKQIGLLGLSFGLPLAIIGAFAVGVGVLAVRTMEATKKMEKFNNLVTKGKDIVKQAKDSVSSLKDRQKELKDTQDKYVKGSQEYLNVGKAIKQLDTDIADAKQKVKESQEAVNIAQNSQKSYDNSKLESQLELERQINSALIDVGISTEDARMLSSDYLREANDGAEQLSQTLGSIDLQNKRIADAVKIDSKKLQDAGFSPQEIEVKIKPLIEAGDWIKSGKEKRGNATSLTDVVTGWLEEQYGQITWALTEFTINWDTTGWISAFQGLFQGFARGVARLPIFSDFWGWIFKEAKIKENYGGKGWAGLDQWINDSIYQIGNYLISGFSNGATLSQLSNNLMEMIDEFFQDPLGYLGITLPEFDIWSIFGFDTVSASSGSSDHPSFMEDLSNILGQDIVTWVTNFNNDPLGTLGISIPSLDLSQIFNLDGTLSYFTTTLSGITTTVSSTVSTVTGLFNDLKSRISGAITGISTNVSTGFNMVKDYAVSKMSAMQQGVKSAIDKVIGAFTHMKDMILSSAKAIWDGVNSKFKSVSDTIGGFYHKLTNPSEWGSAGRKSWSSSPKPNTARKIFSTRSSGVHGAGINPYQKNATGQTVTLNELVGQLGGNKRVNLSDFLALFVGSGFGGWNFGKSHKDYIYGKAKPWKADSPSFNGVTLGNGYQVGRFWDGKPKKFTWEEFMATARAIFSTIPYKFYMDSDWKGDWVSALLSGATNCYDGSMALLSLASLFGFKGNLVHTNLKNGVGHFFVNIAGHNLDTTHFQNSGSWNPLSGGGSPVRHVGGYPSGKTVTVNVDMSNANIYGIDDLDSRIADGVDKGLQKAINDPYTVAI